MTGCGHQRRGIILVPRTNQPPTCAVEHGQQDGRNPRRVAVSHAELPDQLFEKHADRLGESVGEARDDEAARQHRPAPAAIGGLHAARVRVQGNASHDALGTDALSQKPTEKLKKEGQALNKESNGVSS